MDSTTLAKTALQAAPVRGPLRATGAGFTRPTRRYERPRLGTRAVAGGAPRPQRAAALQFMLGEDEPAVPE